MGGKRPPGHRQKGAGTIVVSRGDQVRQGLLVKEWQKTPMQLLQQFCQSKKRIQARYVHARCPEGRFRMRCVLPDDKSSAKDLAFCPEQDFPTMEDAKHAAALLALHNVEPSRPLERLLPEPYDKLWLALGTPTPAAAPATAGASNKKKDAKKKPAAEETATTTDMDLWADAPATSESDAGKPKAKELPTQLTSDRKFASKAEQQLAQLERAQRHNDQQRKRENRERANPHKTVFMSAACRDLIEGVLTRLGVVGGDATAGRDEEEKPAAALGGDEDDDETRKQLEKLGFQPSHIDGALKACRRKQDDDDFLTVVLDWLCLHVPEGELPKGFNPEGTQLDVVVSSRAKPSSPLAAVLVQRLMKLGYDRLDAVVIVQDFVSNHSESLDVQQDAPSDALVLQVVAVAMPHVLKYLSLDAHAALSSAPNDEELQQLREDELFALEAIYDDRMTRETLANGDERLVIQLSEEDVHLELLLPRDSKYPFELPVVSVVATGDARHAPPQLLHAMVNAIQATHASLGEPLIYDLCVSVETSLSDAEKQPRIVLLPHPKATKPAALPAAVPSPAPAAQTKKPGRNDRQRRGASPSTKRGPSREQLQQLSDKLLRLRQAKDARPEFQQMLRARSRLPAAAEKQHILEYLVHDQVVLVCGQTGCGKTTQIPQFILDDYIDAGRGGECNIICTQPRRIAAIGVATRVAQERCEEIADVVGYQIRMDAKKSANTRLLFCTTGVLLRRLLSDRTLAGISHVVVDEVHERNVDTDFLLSILRDLLPQRPDLRLILMSATMNAQLFLDYFSSSKRPCPVLDIPGFTFPVETLFLEDVLATTKYQVPKNLLRDKRKAAPQQPQDGDTAAPQPSPNSMTPEQIVQRLDDSRIDFDLCAHLVQYLVEQRKDAEHTGAILVFLPGTGEIKRLLEMLSSPLVWVLPLHGALSGADQAQVFKAAPVGKTKIILATNIAETSITINDITTVIDCGRVKEMVYDPQLRRSQLLDCWASQAACDQRRGRAGRVQAGTCYRLFSKTRFAKMDAQLAAEIHRVSLAQLCLQIKKLELGSIRTFLSKAIEPPKPDAIDAAVHELLAIAALESVGDQQESEDEHVRLTPLGSHLAMLPLDARIGKFLIYGAILRCVEPVAVIAACISSKPPFNMVMNDPELRGAQEKLKAELGGGAKSDHLLLARLVMEKYAPLTGQKAKRSFCKQFALSYDALETIVDQKAQYLQQLDAIGFYDAAQREPLNANATVPRIVKAALCAGLYDNVIQVVYPDQKYFQAAHGVVTEDHDAKQIRYFVRSSAPPPPTHDTSRFGPWRDRVFMHPSSTNFTQTQYDSPWLLYTELVQTSKVFVRESTMVPPYALLLFGGRLEVLHEKNELCLDGWIRFQAVARIGVLVKAIRRKLDELLAQKIARPELDIAQSELVTAIGVLLKSEGM